MSGTIAVVAGSSTISADPIAVAARMAAHNSPTPVATAIARRMSANSRSPFAPTNIQRRSCRSTSSPSGSPKMILGPVKPKTTTETYSGDPVSAATKTGRAILAMAPAKVLATIPSQSSQKRRNDATNELIRRSPHGYEHPALFARELIATRERSGGTVLPGLSCCLRCEECGV